MWSPTPPARAVAVLLAVAGCRLEVSADAERVGGPDAAPAGYQAGDADDLPGADASAPPALPLVVECEAGSLVGAMESFADPDAAGGLAVRSPPGTLNWSPDGELPPARVDLSIELPEDGTYYVWIRMLGPTKDQDALYAGFAAADLRRFYPTDVGIWEWVHGLEGDPARLRFDDLRAGSVTLSIGPGEDAAACDRVVLTRDPDFDPELAGP